MNTSPSASPEDAFHRAHGLLLSILSGAIAAFHVGELPFGVPMGPVNWSARISNATILGAPIVLILREGNQDLGAIEMTIPREFTPSVLQTAMEDALATLHLDLEDQMVRITDPVEIRRVQAILAVIPLNPRAMASAREDRARVTSILTPHSNNVH